MQKKQANQMDKRAQHLLKLLIDRYIEEGYPVASTTLAKEKSVNFSAATIRNIMMELEEQGYIYSPHTSAGRVPTIQGYRFFVNTILHAVPIKEMDLQSVQTELTSEMTLTDLLQTTTRMLSSVTKMAGIVTLPKRSQVVLKHVEFLPLSSYRVLCVLVLNNREIENRILNTKKAYSQRELQSAANFFNHHFAGKPLTLELRSALLAAMRQDQQDMEVLLSAAMQAAETAVAEKAGENDFLLEGQDRLLEMARHGNIDGLKTLFEAFRQKQDILHLLDQCLDADGLQIFIGKESGFQALGDCSVVTAPYSVHGKVLGALAVVGPTRMAYDKIIPVVDITAKLLSRALKDAE